MEKSLRGQFQYQASLDFPADFIGYEITKKGNAFDEAMETNIERLTFLSKDVTFNQYISLHDFLLWLAHARLKCKP